MLVGVIERITGRLNNRSCSAAENPRDLAKSSRMEQLPGKNMSQKILVVDDEEQVRTVVGEVLRSLGYEVLVADDGVEALEVVEKTPNLDLVLTDVVMPNMGGFEMVNELQTQRPEIEVIFMSGYAGDEELVAQVSDGKARFLAKPFAPGDLERKVQIA